MNEQIQIINEHIYRIEELLAAINLSTSCNFSSNDCKLQFLALRARPTLEYTLKDLREQKKKLLKK